MKFGLKDGSRKGMKKGGRRKNYTPVCRRPKKMPKAGKMVRGAVGLAVGVIAIGAAAKALS